MVALQERNSFSTREDLYKGHKVVAMPSTSSSSSSGSSGGGGGSGSGGNVLSVRDMVFSRNTFDPNRPRSLSAGRATTRGRDIVQEVYDRMGVNRGGSEIYDETLQTNMNGSATTEKDGGSGNISSSRGRSSAPTKRRDHSPDVAEKFSQRYRAAAALSSPRNAVGEQQQQHRGRSSESGGGGGSVEPRRSRSLSRGRAVAGRWPPASSQTSSEQTSATVAPQTMTSFKTRKKQVAEEPVATTSSSTTAAAAVQAPSVRKTFSRSESQDDNAGSDNESTSKSQEKPTSASSAPPSVKDRISAYAGVRNSARNFPQKKPANYQTYASRERPKPIDIYEEARKQEQPNPKLMEQDDVVAMPPEPSAVPPSPAAAAAADAAFALVRGSGNAARSSKSASGSSRTPKATTGIAGAYLGAIKASPSATSAGHKPIVVTTTPITSAPLTEISAADPSGDGHSVAASSVSADEFNFTSPAARSVGATTSVKRPTWAEHRSKSHTTPTSRHTTDHYNSNGNKPSTPSASDIERMVEQKVQARVSVVEMRMEEQMQRLERRVEEKLKSRISVLDDKLDKMNSMLAMLLSRELSGSPNNNGNNEI